MDIYFGESTIDEIISENKRLNNELISTNKCLNVLIRFKSFVDTLFGQLTDKIDQNDSQKYYILSKDVNEMKESLFRQKFCFSPTPDTSKVISKSFVCRRDNCCGERFDSSEDYVKHIEKRLNNCGYSVVNSSAHDNYEMEVSEGIGSTEEDIYSNTGDECLNICTEEGIDDEGSNKDKVQNSVKEVVEIGTQTDEPVPDANVAQLQFIELPAECVEMWNTVQQPVTSSEPSPRRRGRPRAQLECTWPGCNFKISHSRKKLLLEAHMNEHKGLDPYICDHVGCGQGFKCNESLRKHKKTHVDLLQEAMNKVLEPNNKIDSEEGDEDSEPPVDVLSLIKPNMQYSEQLMELVTSTPKDTSLTCFWPECDFKVADIKHKSKLEAHLNEHQGVKPFACDQSGCGQAFTSKDRLQNHYKRTHDTKAFICDYEGCGQRFRRRYRLIEHICRHTGEYRFECKDCGKKFIKRDTMNQHIDRMHKRLEVALICNIDECGKEFRTYMAYKVHQLKVHTKEKRFACDEPDCQFKTVSNDKLGRHKINVHKKIKPFSCEFPDCDNDFADQQLLDQHLKSVHSKQLTFKCTQMGCERAYRLQADLDSHIRLKHSSNKIKCDWPGCEFKASNIPILKYHQADVHLGIRNHKCDWPECDKAFKRKWHLKEHMRMHRNERPYACPWPGCGYKAVTSGTLTGHLRVHNKYKNTE